MTVSSAAPKAPASSSRTPRGASAGKHPGIVLAIIVSCQMMVVVDATAMSVALPGIRSSLDFSPTGLSWVLNAYILAYGGLLLGGRTGDIFGRRRTFTAGVLLFTLCSLLGGLAAEPWQLLAARALQGVGAAFAAPGAMSLLMTNFPEGAPRHRALAAYSTLAGLGMAIGMIVSGVLTDVASWRWVLFINVPVGIAIVLLTPKYVADPERNPGRLDLVGAFTATAGIIALAWGFIRVAGSGWGGAVTPAAFAAAVVLLVVFVIRQLRTDHPMMPVRLFADRGRTAGYLSMALTMACNFSVSLFVPMLLQNVLGYSALTTGLSFLPMALVMFGMSRATPKLLPRFGAFPLIVTGLALVAAGVGWLGQVDADVDYAPSLLLPLILIGTGIGTFLMPLTGLILGGVPPRDSGAASGLLQTFQQTGGALGIAVLITVYGTTLRGAAPGTPERVATTRGIGHAFTGGAVFVGCAVLLMAATALLAGARNRAAAREATEQGQSR